MPTPRGIRHETSIPQRANAGSKSRGSIHGRDSGGGTWSWRCGCLTVDLALGKVGQTKDCVTSGDVEDAIAGCAEGLERFHPRYTPSAITRFAGSLGSAPTES